jgi:hypothetical protein
MPGMLRKSTAFVPRCQKFESISLQGRVRCEPHSDCVKHQRWRVQPNRCPRRCRLGQLPRDDMLVSKRPGSFAEHDAVRAHRSRDIFDLLLAHVLERKGELVAHLITHHPADALIDFYESYLPAIFRYDWVRIFVFAGLKGVGITQHYLDLIQKRVIEPLGFELRRVAGLTDEPDRALSADELEIAWSLHGELFYLAIRRWVYGMKTPDDLGPIIRAAVVRFLEGAPAAMCDLRETHLAIELPQ